LRLYGLLLRGELSGMSSVSRGCGI